jgi:Protein of unknown function (DUF3024)
MPAAPKPSEFDVARVRRWADERVPVEHRDEVRLEVGVRGANVTIFELRQPWCEDVGPGWSRRPLVQLRHTGSGFWLLLWQDRRGRWQRYPLAPRPSRDLGALLAEIDEDGISLFST